MKSDEIIQGFLQPKSALGLIGGIILALFSLVMYLLNFSASLAKDSHNAINNNTKALAELQTLIREENRNWH